ncbi:MAG: glycosyltransferase [bacterium]|nr:glycosyltransferase [bacterium]
MNPTVAVVRGKFLNRYEMQFFEPLTEKFAITAFGSKTSYHDAFAFPVVKLPSPVDLPEFPFKMPILNRLFIDGHYLWGLEKRLEGFDLIHAAETYFHYTQQCLHAKKKGYVKKVIATVLENIPFNNEGIWGRKQFKRRAREELDLLIALTHKTKDALILEGADPAKIVILPHFIDTKRFRPTTAKRTKKNEFVILFCGRVEAYKGVFDIVEAARILLNDPGLKSFTLKFLMAGHGIQEKRVLNLERRYGLEPFFSHTSSSYDDMPGLYNQADIFVAPSKSTSTWEEQYSTVLLEAQASGLPIVTTNSGGIPENVGDAGLLVEPGNAQAIAESLKRFILSITLRQAYAKKARERAVRVHDVKIGAQKLADIYRRVLSS